MNTSRISGVNILTIGCEFEPPRGGVAQVLYTYKNEVFESFNFISNSGGGGKIKKLLLAFCGYIKMAFLLMTNGNIKIIHIHSASYVSFKRSSYFVGLAKTLGRKVVLHIHGGGFKDYYKTNPDWILSVLRKADCIITLTDNWNRFFSIDLKLPNVVTVHNIVPNPIILRGVHKGKRIHLLFLGAINESKGIFDLLDVIRKNKNRWKDKLLLHVCGNQEVGRLQNYINENDLNNIVNYEGWVEGEDKVFLLNLMDAFILPSYVEGLPISLLESLSYGKPVITTFVGGIPELVNNENGFLFNPGDKDAIEDIIRSILINPSILREKGQKARFSVKQNYPESVVKALSDIYKKMVS